MTTSEATIRPFDRLNAVIGAGVWLIAFTVYYLTKAPTLSLWDCGEFIAACASLGVPHPPGTPLYVLMGRVFSMLPIAGDIAVRINLLSVVSSAFTALFGYLIAVRILRATISQTGSVFDSIIVYAGAAAGAFFLAFGLTNWNNSVEAEVYGLSMMIMMAVVWLTLYYRENRDSAAGERAILLAFFLVFAGVGIHLTTFIVIPAVALFVVLKPKSSSAVWLVLGALFVFELYMIFALSSRPGEVPYFVPVVIVLIFFLFYMFSYDKVPVLYLFVAAGMLMAAVPIVGLGISAITDRFSGSSPGNGLQWLSTVGVIVFIALLLAGMYLLFAFFRNKRTGNANPHYLYAGLFIQAAGLMAALLYVGSNGYVVFLILSSITLAVALVILRRLIDWTVLVAIAAVSLVIIGVEAFALGVLLGGVVVVVLGKFFHLPSWRKALLIIVLSVLGYSTHLYIPIRSAQQPMINENNPSQSLDAFVNFIERKQYERQSMISRMFVRRGEWINQFGEYDKMGFWRFFSEQYGFAGSKFIGIFVVGLFGIWETIRKKPRIGVVLTVLLLLSSVGLVLYMNFADGTRQHPVTGTDYLEVRDRDYFFTPAFILFGLSIGLGISYVIQLLRESMAKSPRVVTGIVVSVSCLLFLSPSLTLATNYYFADRSGNYIAFDYGWNILISTDPDGVVITAGDNDTFPLWCLQEAYRIRNDVAVINLSLANASWYIKQIQSNMGVNLGWTEGQIDSLRVFRDQFGNVHRLQDQVVTALIKNNLGRRPIDFCVTVPPSGKSYLGQSIDSMLSMQGMTWRLNPTGGEPRIDVAKTIDLMTNPEKFKYRSVADSTVYKTDAARRIANNYAKSFMQVAEFQKDAGDPALAEQLMLQAVERFPQSADAVNYLGLLYSEYGETKKLGDLIATSRVGDHELLNTLLGRLKAGDGNRNEAEQIWQTVLTLNPHYKRAFEELMRFYYDDREIAKLDRLVQKWLVDNPDDQEIRTLLNNIRMQMRDADTGM